MITGSGDNARSYEATSFALPGIRYSGGECERTDGKFDSWDILNIGRGFRGSLP